MPVLSIHGILVAILLLLPVGYAADADTSDDTSDSSLLSMVPDCALDCLNSFIKSEFTPEQCKSPSNIPCLCRHKSTSGESLGGAALSCVLSGCSQEVLTSSNAYRICDSVSGALSQTRKTHTTTILSDSTITMKGGAATTGEASSTDSAGTTVVFMTSIMSLTPTPATSSTTSSASSDLTFYNPLSSASETQQTTSTEPTSVPSSDISADTNKKNHHGISAAAVIGMSVASGLAGSFIIGVAVFFCCKRRRKQQRSVSDPHVFEIGGAMTEPPDFSKPMPRLPTSGLDPGSSPSPVSSEGRNTQQMSSVQPMAFIRPQSPYSPGYASASHQPPNNHSSRQERIGFAISSDSDWDTSPRTQSSQHSVARLIPEGSIGLYPKPLKWSHRPASGETLFEEDESQQAAFATGKTTRNSPKPGVAPKLAGLPANPRAYKGGGVRIPAGPRPGPPRALAPPFSHTSTLRTSTSDSSTAPNDTANTSNHTSTSNTNTNTLLPPFTTKAQDQNRTANKPPAQTPQPSPIPSSSTLPAGSEIVSKPRIVQGKDIKRVQIRNSPRPPSEVVAPYCPDDLWLERGRTLVPPKSRNPSGELPYPSDLFSGDVHYPDSPKKKAVTVSNRVSPTSRNLTPSRRGEDLILRVD
ncbi:uncharacterized protein N7446_002457 [Penicillium canescens]|uniref:CFEM domain-containing protein n=1 Tax=Penicillium canescens TaxID=5083 RepID=A0AAD6NAS1_PENCN|nr:uncharacterized protein N7446_002457 [Penicillium canescens]KAJ6044260.1 hypothetical protein N7460_005615 [Penicillium canescens]KAJ6055730.1 hypothetical protein N7444_004828 [Penicillium canescens]KAJ6074680.1 hypothetical protein N7446_002457 [Penicillium canescens]